MGVGSGSRAVNPVYLITVALPTASGDQTLIGMSDPMATARNETLVMYTAIGAGHLGPVIQLANLFLPHGFSVAIVIPDGAIGGIDALISSANPSISFHRIAPSPIPSTEPPLDPVVNAFRQIQLANPLLLSLLRSLSSTSHLRAFIIDFFCTDALDVAQELNIPSYFFFSTNATILAAFLHLPTLPYRAPAEIKALGSAHLHFPGVSAPMPASYLPDIMVDHGDEAFEFHLFHFSRLAKADGIIANTSRSLEENPLSAIEGGLCVPGQTVPPIYCIGPLVNDSGAVKEEKPECISWLGTQPPRSVVFLCFGSMHSLASEQLKEIAKGLERSGQRFLWVVRSSEPDPDLLVPGFADRTKGKGIVVTSWAPQAEILMHQSVGGFVTHCGWNSVQEAIRGGVPMIAWPMYAEQRMNKLSLVGDMKIATEMKGSDEGWVGAEEVAARVTWLMESEGGRELRERALAAKESAAAALREGGASHAALMELVSKWKPEPTTGGVTPAPAAVPAIEAAPTGHGLNLSDVFA